MEVIALIGGGMAVLVGGMIGRRRYMRYLSGVPAALVRVGKSWGRTTDRHVALRSLNTFFYLTGMGVTLAGIVIGVAGLVRVDTIPPVPAAQTIPTDDALSAHELLRQVNQQRKNRKLKELNEDTRLNAVAQQRFDDMVQRQYYSHINPDGKYFYDLFPAQLIKADYSCENLDVEFTVDESRYVSDWLHSTKGHKECMLNPNVTSAGYAVGLFSQTAGDRIYLVVGIHTSSISKLEPPATVPSARR
jgi:uncharacterized protein YkwD